MEMVRGRDAGWDRDVRGRDAGWDGDGEGIVRGRVWLQGVSDEAQGPDRDKLPIWIPAVRILGSSDPTPPVGVDPGGSDPQIPHLQLE